MDIVSTFKSPWFIWKAKKGTFPMNECPSRPFLQTFFFGTSPIIIGHAILRHKYFDNLQHFKAEENEAEHHNTSKTNVIQS